MVPGACRKGKGLRAGSSVILHDNPDDCVLTAASVAHALHPVQGAPPHKVPGAHAVVCLQLSNLSSADATHLSWVPASQVCCASSCGSSQSACGQPKGCPRVLSGIASPDLVIFIAPRLQRLSACFGPSTVRIDAPAIGRKESVLGRSILTVLCRAAHEKLCLPNLHHTVPAA